VDITKFELVNEQIIELFE
jgi:hypothetical protein